jgi:predicted nucleic acid-binding protein
MPKVLLDTSFVLPSLGIGMKPDATKGLESLARGRAEVSFSSFNILESLWVASRMMGSPGFDQGKFSEGLKSVLDSGVYERLEEDFGVFSRALELRKLGHRDIIDDILYAHSAEKGMKLLTVDSKLRSFIRERGLEDTTVFPSEMGTLL